MTKEPPAYVCVSGQVLNGPIVRFLGVRLVLLHKLLFW
jgi:hypothetical protein